MSVEAGPHEVKGYGSDRHDVLSFAGMDGVYSYCVGLFHIAASAKNTRRLPDGNHVLDLCTFPLSLEWTSIVGIYQHTPVADKVGRLRSRRLRAIICVVIALPVF